MKKRTPVWIENVILMVLESWRRTQIWSSWVANLLNAGDEGLYLPNSQPNFGDCPTCTVSIVLEFQIHNTWADMIIIYFYLRAPWLNNLKGSFTLATAVYGFCSGLCQYRDRNFSIPAEQRNHLPQMHAENAVMWISLSIVLTGTLPSCAHTKLEKQRQVGKDRVCKWSDFSRYVGTWLLPIEPRLLGRSRFKTYLRPVYFLLQSTVCCLSWGSMSIGDSK